MTRMARNLLFAAFRKAQKIWQQSPVLTEKRREYVCYLVLVLLLTTGGPDIAGTIIPAGGTDILASYTYRMAFDDSGAQFGLAGVTLHI